MNRNKTEERRLVIKVGTSLLTNSEGRLDLGQIERLAAEISSLRQEGHRVLLVSSGAIAAGVGKLGWSQKPATLADKQAAAAVGQVTLMERYEACFSKNGVPVGQVLLTRQDLEDRARYLNARTTLLKLLDLGVVPIINENDTVAVEEIRVGDNDTLAAIVAAKVEADLVILLTDVEGLFPAKGLSPLAPIRRVEAITPEIEALARKTTGFWGGTGGMSTKIQAARIATASGVTLVIASGRKPGVLQRVVNGEPEGTLFVPQTRAMGAKKRWIAFGARPKGKLHVDAGAAEAVVRKGRSLLPSGISRVEGRFQIGEMVSVVGPDGHEAGRGLVNFSSKDLERIKGLKTHKVQELLGESVTVEEAIHRDNLVVLK